jgi:hypothetical protein
VVAIGSLETEILHFAHEVDVRVLDREQVQFNRSSDGK